MEARMAIHMDLIMVILMDLLVDLHLMGPTIRVIGELLEVVHVGNGGQETTSVDSIARLVVSAMHS